MNSVTRARADAPLRPSTRQQTPRSVDAASARAVWLASPTSCIRTPTPTAVDSPTRSRRSGRGPGMTPSSGPLAGGSRGVTRRTRRPWTKRMGASSTKLAADRERRARSRKLQVIRQIQRAHGEPQRERNHRGTGNHERIKDLHERRTTDRRSRSARRSRDPRKHKHQAHLRVCVFGDPSTHEPPRGVVRRESYHSTIRLRPSFSRRELKLIRRPTRLPSGGDMSAAAPEAWRQVRDTLDFDDDQVLDDEIDFIFPRGRPLSCPVCTLPGVTDALVLQLDGQRRFIERFEQAWPEHPMHLDGRADDVGRQTLQPSISVTLWLCGSFISVCLPILGASPQEPQRILALRCLTRGNVLRTCANSSALS